MSDSLTPQMELGNYLVKNRGLASDPSSLRRSLSGNNEEDLRRAAEEFESVFMNMVFQKMKEMIPESEVFNNPKAKVYESMLYDEYAKMGSQTKSIGIADMIYQQFQQRLQVTSEESK